MFYDPSDRASWPFAHDPFKALVAPRPIGWISTTSKDGVVNLAPYSFFNAVSTEPHVVFFASQQVKDSQRNAEETGEFVHNLVGWDLRDAMNATSAGVAADVSEPELAGIPMAASKLVKPPRVAGAPAAMECRHLHTALFAGDYAVVFGEVVGIHIDDRYVSDGIVDSQAMGLVARMGYDQYVAAQKLFSMKRPG